MAGVGVVIVKKRIAQIFGLQKHMEDFDPFEAFAEAVSWFEGTELSDVDRLKIARTNAIDLFKLDLS